MWVLSMEKMVPSMQREIQQTEIIDNLQHTQIKLTQRKKELQARLKDILQQAAKAQKRKDVHAMKNRIVSARRIKIQLQKMESASMILEDNMDSIVNNDMHRDVIYTLQQATSILKTQIMEIGGVESVSELMVDLDTEMQHQKEITDALCKTPLYMHNSMSTSSAEDLQGMQDESEADLETELHMMLMEEEDDDSSLEHQQHARRGKNNSKQQVPSFQQQTVPPLDQQQQLKQRNNTAAAAIQQQQQSSSSSDYLMMMH